MNYKQIEQSLASRTPIRLYTFKLGAVCWDYNTSSETVIRHGVRYKTIKGGISDRGIIVSDGGISDNFTLTAPATIEIARLFDNMPPSSRLTLEVANTHLQTDEVIPTFWGVVVTVTEKTAATVEITASPNETMTNRPGVTLVYSRTCGAMIYDHQCKVNKELYKVRTTLQQIAVSAVTVSEAGNYSDGWFSGGFIEYTNSNGELDRRYIEQHTGTTLHLWGGTQGLNQSQAINLYAGCNGSPDACANKFNNSLNRQAFDHLQGWSPFDGSQIF